MCNFFSAIGQRDGSILWQPMLDSHSDLLEYFEIDDTEDYQSRFVKLELTPPALSEEVLKAPESWTFHADEPTQPVWCDEAVLKEFRERMVSIIRSMLLTSGIKRLIADGCWIVCGDVQVKRVVGGRIWQLCGSAQVGNVCGSAQVGNVYGPAKVGSVYGSAKVGDVYGSAKVGSVYGSAQVGKDLRTKEIQAAFPIRKRERETGE